MFYTSGKGTCIKTVPLITYASEVPYSRGKHPRVPAQQTLLGAWSGTGSEALQAGRRSDGATRRQGHISRASEKNLFSLK